MSIKIGQASLGETGGRNQQPGNQSGRELNISNWYNGRWLGILRYKSPKKAPLAAPACEAAIKNRNIGYDMDNRNTAYEAARAVGWDVSRIAKPVETDCSALMMLCAVAAGCGYGERGIGQRQQFADGHAGDVMRTAQTDAGVDVEERGGDFAEVFAQSFGGTREVALGG